MLTPEQAAALETVAREMLKDMEAPCDRHKCCCDIGFGQVLHDYHKKLKGILRDK